VREGGSYCGRSWCCSCRAVCCVVLFLLCVCLCDLFLFFWRFSSAPFFYSQGRSFTPFFHSQVRYLRGARGAGHRGRPLTVALIHTSRPFTGTLSSRSSWRRTPRPPIHRGAHSHLPSIHRYAVFEELVAQDTEAAHSQRRSFTPPVHSQVRCLRGARGAGHRGRAHRPRPGACKKRNRSHTNTQQEHTHTTHDTTRTTPQTTIR